MIPFRVKPSLVATLILQHVFFSNEGPLLETLEFFEICHGSYQSSNFLPYLSLYAVFYSSTLRIILDFRIGVQAAGSSGGISGLISPNYVLQHIA